MEYLESTYRIVIEKDADDEYSPFLAVDRDTARAELSAASERE
jgi:hypothetical protein